MNYLILPFLVGGAFSAAAWYWSIYPCFSDVAESMTFGGTIASISTTMLGFILAAFAILTSITHTHLVKEMQRSGHYRDLLKTMLSNCLFFFVCAVGGYVMLFGAHAGNAFLAFIEGVHVAAFFGLINVGRKLWFVLGNLKTS